MSLVLLFRFSALTYNAHRIHDDRDHAVGVEGYPGLVVLTPRGQRAMSATATVVPSERET